MKFYFELFHCWFWAALHWAHAYLAWHRGEKVVCAEHENQMREYERQMIVLKLNRRLQCAQ